MRYNFDEITDRRGSGSYKWDSAEGRDIIPMWVADMDFKTAPVIIDALRRRVDHGVFGYERVPDKYYEALTGWWSRRHRFDFKREDVIYTSGVVPAISAIIKALTNPGDKVIVQTPVYNCFFSSIRNNDCVVLENPLIYENGSYSMDFADLERKAADPRAGILLLCNPHNPAGRAWNLNELKQVAEICERHGLALVSDEIHCEIVNPEGSAAFQSIGTVNDWCRDNAVVCCSPTKAFNIAGLQIANIVCRDHERLKHIDRAININEVCDVNVMGVEALIAAYTPEGEEWLRNLNAYIYENYKVLREYFAKHLPELTVTELEATYLVWVDCRPLRLTSLEIEEKLLETEQLWLNSGSMYGGEGFMRINIACPHSVMLEGLNRFSRFARQILSND